MRLLQIVFAPAKCYTWQLQNHPIPMSKYNAFLQAVQFCLLHHVGISLFQVDVQDRHHVVSLRRPAVRPQVWLLDLLWLAGWLWQQRVPLILFKLISFFEDLFSPHWLSDLLCFSHPRQEDSISISVFLFCKQTWPSSLDL